jgi:ribosomal protein S12 methylthiotransferase
VTPNKLFHLISLGCAKNRVDSERILSVLVSAGFVYTDDPSEAGLIVVNTCSFIEPAVDESIDVILDSRAENPSAFIVAAGCLPLRYRKDLTEALPEADLCLTPDRIEDLPGLIRSVSHETRRSLGSRDRSPSAGIADRSFAPRVLTTLGYAYLKISEGCSRRCRYCTIPSIRGSMRSAQPDELEAEAAFLASQGVRELVLVAQDLTGYGVDLDLRGALVALLERIRRIRGLSWIRLMYLYPNAIPRGLPRLIRESENVLPYLDIPIQHISDKVLRAMGRPWKGDRVRKLVERLRKEIPGLVIRTTVMVGYPAEGEEEFSELRDFLSSYDIERVGVFAYSPEEGTPAFELGDPVPQLVKQDRADEIRSMHLQATEKRNHARIGSVEDALVEGISPDTEFLLQGRTWDQAPEIDGVLYITAGDATAGEIQKIRITDAHAADLFGEIV